MIPAPAPADLTDDLPAGLGVLEGELHQHHAQVLREWRRHLRSCRVQRPPRPGTAAILALVAEEPSSTTEEIAEASGRPVRQVYGVLWRAARRGVVVAHRVARRGERGTVCCWTMA